MWQDMEKLARMFQEQMVDFRRYLEDTRFTGESDDKKVLVVANGLEEIISISIYSEKLPDDVRQDLEQTMTQAVNSALLKVRDCIKQKTHDLTGGFNFPYY